MNGMVTFAGYCFDAGRRTLTSAGGHALHLTPKAFDLLHILIDASPRVVSKTELHQQLWPGTFVSDAALTSLVKELRRVLRDKDRTTPLIKTAHGVGYALDWPGIQEDESSAEHWLIGPRRRYALHEGVNVIGRDPGVEVWLDEPDVSRRHARVIVRGEQAAIEDLGSKNGTIVGGNVAAGLVALEDGNRIHAGGVQLTYRRQTSDRSTLTLPEPKTSVNIG